MAFDREHMLLQWSGFIVAGTNSYENFSGSMRFANTSLDPGSIGLGMLDNDDAMTDVIADLTKFWSGQGSFIPPMFQITSIKWNRIDVNGLYVNRNATRERVGLDIRGGSTTSLNPAFVSLVTTYGTGTQRGLARKGRTYWPYGPAASDNAGTLSLVNVQTAAARTATLIRDWGNWPGFDQTDTAPCVMSKERGGATRRITTVQVGNQLDVQLRRKRTPETYTEEVV